MKRKWLLPVVMVAALVPTAFGLCGCLSRTGGPASAAPSISYLNESGSPVEFSLNSQQEGIWVNGTGEVTVKPDIATIRLGVEALEATVAEAQEQASQVMNEIRAALLGSGIAESDIQTAYFNIRQQTRWDDNNNEEIVTGYRVTNSVIAKVRDIEKVGSIIDSAVSAGGDLIRIDNVSFSVEDPSLYYEEAREKAMNDARDRAEQLAELAGVTLGAPVYISEGASSPVYRDVFYEMGGGLTAPVPSSADSSISPGEMEVSLVVQVVYGILQ